MTLLVAAIVTLQVARERWFRSVEPDRDVIYVQSPEVMKRLALSFDALLADVYWIRTVQYYGRTRLSDSPNKNYDLLPLLLFTTTELDLQFSIAYRFGGIFLSEPPPGGPGRTDLAIELLQKGIRNNPNKWEYYVDAGFVHYWWRDDYQAASDWFVKASQVPGAPNWLRPLAASTIGEGGSRQAARFLWEQMRAQGEQEWLRRTATHRLLQLDALDAIDDLSRIVQRFEQTYGRLPASWPELVGARLLRGIPLDPTGTPYVLDPATGGVDVSKDSPLFPLRRPKSRPAA
jgi:hypothetical protein